MVKFEVKIDKPLDYDLTSKLKTALTKCALIVEADAKLKCPVDTGELRQSITHEVYRDGCVIGTNYEYAPYVEYGTGLYASNGLGRQDKWSYQDSKGQWHTTVGQKPQPFLQPALNDNRDKIVEIIKDSITGGK